MSKDFFYNLTPDKILKAAESCGGVATGRIFQLNSLENRVYEIEMEDDASRVAKFYRSGRWSAKTILDEHGFLEELLLAEVPVVAPLEIKNSLVSKTLGKNEDGLYYAIFPKVYGRAPDELSVEQATQLGRLVARMHVVGSQKKAEHRLEINPYNYGELPLDFLIKGDFISPEIKSAYVEVASRIIKEATPLFKNLKTLRLHGDCHLGNLLFNKEQAFFLDFDDMVMGPAVQDVWLATSEADLREAFLNGYQEMRPFDFEELKLIKPLRALRIINYSAWVAKRFEDPFFKRIFVDFGSYKYWAQEVEALQRLWLS
ncbi:MAG: serine/threonine protein kinase [Oligoflexia bacterium]|nr:serine/threonine protein kinase [Oligoflexia bacterium]